MSDCRGGTEFGEGGGKFGGTQVNSWLWSPGATGQSPNGDETFAVSASLADECCSSSGHGYSRPMTHVRPPVSALRDDPHYLACVADLLGVLAYGELVAFERLAADAAMAPTFSDKTELAYRATLEFSSFLRLRDRLSELGLDADTVMEPFREPLDSYHSHTAPGDWLEGLMKVYVGDGISSDFYREIAHYVDSETSSLVLEVCDARNGDFVVERIRSAIEQDPRVAGRLALWGRRLVGEALTQAQRVAADRDGISTLLVGGADRPGADLAELGRMFARLTDDHTKRMQALGLAA